jgi:hypothetical protein
MHDDWLEQELGRSLRRAGDARAPSFDVVLADAEDNLARQALRRRAGFGLAAAVAAIAVVLVSRSPSGLPADYDFAIDEALLADTRWRAPSDVLMPEHRFDVYMDMPAMPVSTDLEEGTLL